MAKKEEKKEEKKAAAKGSGVKAGGGSKPVNYQFSLPSNLKLIGKGVTVPVDNNGVTVMKSVEVKKV